MPRKRLRGKGLPIGVYWQNGAYRYKARNERERAVLGKLWTRLGKTEDDVHRNYWNLVGSRIGSKGGMQDLWEQYERRVLPGKSPRTRKDDRTMWKFLEPVFGQCHPGEITRSDGIGYIEARAKQAASRAKKEFALLRHMMNKAVDWEIIKTNPLQGTRVADYARVDIRDRTPEIWELLAVKKHGNTLVQLFIDFKYQTGLDQGVMFSLRIPSFDGPGLPVKRTKTNKRGYIEWTEEFKATVRAIIAYNNNRSEFLFCNTKGDQVKVDSFSQVFRKVVNRAIKAGDLIEPYRPNDIRSAHGTDAEEIYGLDATNQLLNGPGAKKHYVHMRQGQKVTPLPVPRLRENE